MRKQLISFAQVIKFCKISSSRGGFNPNPNSPCVRPWDVVPHILNLLFRFRVNTVQGMKMRGPALHSLNSRLCLTSCAWFPLTVTADACLFVATAFFDAVSRCTCSVASLLVTPVLICHCTVRFLFCSWSRSFLYFLYSTCRPDKLTYYIAIINYAGCKKTRVSSCQVHYLLKKCLRGMRKCSYSHEEYCCWS